MLGSYIVVEGIDGSGKTTLVDNLVKEINKIDGESAVGVREPYNTDLKDIIEKVKNSEPWNEDEILAQLFSVDRLLLKDIIFQYMSSGIHVVSDRSKFSSYAYQSVDIQYNMLLNQYMLDPNAILYLDIDPRTAKERYMGDDKFENSVTLGRARKWYNRQLPQLASDHGINFAKLEISPYTPKQVAEFMLNALKEFDLV